MQNPRILLNDTFLIYKYHVIKYLIKKCIPCIRVNISTFVQKNKNTAVKLYNILL